MIGLILFVVVVLLVLGILGGPQTSEEWYEEQAERWRQGKGPLP